MGMSLAQGSHISRLWLFVCCLFFPVETIFKACAPWEVQPGPLPQGDGPDRLVLVSRHCPCPIPGKKLFSCYVSSYNPNVIT